MSAPEDAIEEELRREKIERLTTAARVYRKRGDLESAVTSCQELLTLDPDNLDAREVMADVLAEDGKHDEAMAQYRRIFEADSSRTDVERKMAQMALRAGELRRREQRRQELIEDPTRRDRRSDVRLSTAWLCALICPGMGQLYLREYAKGAIILGGSLVLIALILNAFVAAVGAAVREGTLMALFEHLGGSGGRTALLLFACLLTLGLYVFGIFDAVRSVRRIQASEEEELGI